jgi:hypothetical protein
MLDVPMVQLAFMMYSAGGIFFVGSAVRLVLEFGHVNTWWENSIAIFHTLACAIGLSSWVFYLVK